MVGEESEIFENWAYMLGITPVFLICKLVFSYQHSPRHCLWLLRILLGNRSQILDLCRSICHPVISVSLCGPYASSRMPTVTKWRSYPFYIWWRIVYKSTTSSLLVYEDEDWFYFIMYNTSSLLLSEGYLLDPRSFSLINRIMWL